MLWLWQTTACDAVSLLTDVTAISDHYTEVVIDPKSNHIVSVELRKGEELTWKFSTEKRDINFGVRFLEENNGEEWDEIIPLQRTQAQLKEQTGSFRAPCSGTLVFTWDNSYSVIRWVFITLFRIDLILCVLITFIAQTKAAAVHYKPWR